jgi:hypothetical protein
MQLNYTPDPNDQYVGFQPVPAGEYRVQITDTAIKDTKSGLGKVLNLTYEIVGDPDLSGRKVFDTINLDNPSVDAVRIGKQKLNTICVLTGVKKLRDTAELHGKVLTIQVSVGEYNGKPNNRVDKYIAKESDGTFGDDEETPPPAGEKKKPSFVK